MKSVAEQTSLEKRVALVIGNGAYRDTPLRNPPNDARAIANALNSLGFNVISAVNSNRKEMRNAIEEFGQRIRNGGVGLFYYAGHGVQSAGKNYMIPVGAEITSEGDLEDEAVNIDRVLARMDDARNRMNIVILDACRNNPYASSFRSASRGLAQMKAPVGTFIAYATAPGSVAEDGDAGNGVYTQQLLREMQIPNQPIETVFKRVLSAVKQTTGGKQVPWVSTSIEGDFFFAERQTVQSDFPEMNSPVVEKSTRPILSDTELFSGRWSGVFYYSPGSSMSFNVNLTYNGKWEGTIQFGNATAEPLADVRINANSFYALRPGDHNAVISGSLVSNYGITKMQGTYLESGISRTIEITKQ